MRATKCSCSCSSSGVAQIRHTRTRTRKLKDDRVKIQEERSGSGYRRVCRGEDSDHVDCFDMGSPGRRRVLSAMVVPVAAAFMSMESGVSIPRAAEASNIDRKQRLLDLISSAAPSADVAAAIDDLVTSGGRDGAVTGGGIGEDSQSFMNLLDGRWRLLWSSDGAEVSRFTKFLPQLFASYQLIGAAGGLERGRAANVISTAGGLIKLKLSSSAMPSTEDNRFDSVIIGPPFVFELLIDDGNIAAVPLGSESSVGSDESPLLGSMLNTFTQLYVEPRGAGANCLRICKVTEGDPGVEGSTFVYVRV